jgi:hypothetical protein
MSVAAEPKENAGIEEVDIRAYHFLSCARMCEFKKCCKKYKHGKRCKRCPKKEDK